jgi:6-phosphogluconolactonase (cycloisomerase 2 family)
MSYLIPQAKKQKALASFQYDTVTGVFNLLNQQPVSGVRPCHVAIDATGSMVVTANYGDGSVAVPSPVCIHFVSPL